MNKKTRLAVDKNQIIERIILLYKAISSLGLFVLIVGILIFELFYKKNIGEDSKEAYFIFACFMFLWSFGFLFIIKRVADSTGETKKQYNKNIRKDFIIFIILLCISMIYGGVKYLLGKEVNSTSTNLFYYISICSEFLSILVVSEIAIFIYKTIENNASDFSSLRKMELYINVMLLPLFLLFAYSNYIVFYLLSTSYLPHLFLIISSLLLNYLIKIFNYSKTSRVNSIHAIINSNQYYRKK